MTDDELCHANCKVSKRIRKLEESRERWSVAHSDVCYQRDALQSKLDAVEKLLRSYGPLMPSWIENKLRRAMGLGRVEDNGD